MALRTVEQRKKVLHTANKQNKRTASSVGSSSPGASQVDQSGEMTSSSSRIFLSSDEVAQVRSSESVDIS